MSDVRRKLESSQKFQKWIENIKANRVHLKHYELLHLVENRHGEMLFAFLKADMESPEGKKLPPIVVLRGHFVAVLPHLIASDTQKQFTLLVKQRRVATGGYFYEFPAGMCDEAEDPIPVAIRELEEESGLKVMPSDLIPLNDQPIFSSPGLLDEGGYFFALQLFLPESQIWSLDRQRHGVGSESEWITTKIVNFAQANQYIANTHGFTLLYLYHRYLQHSPLS